MFTLILKTIGVVVLGALGALIFVVFLLPYLLTNPYFENYQFVRDFKQGKIVVNQKESVYIQENMGIEEAIQRVKNSVVTIIGTTVVSGLIVTSDGSIITLASVIPANGNFQIYIGGEKQLATVVKIDRGNNLALLKVGRNNMPTIGFANINDRALGRKVFLVAPTSIKGDNWVAGDGIIREVGEDIIKTTIFEKPIANGGPLFNVAGELVGLNFIDGEGRISAISINKIQNLLGL